MADQPIDTTDQQAVTVAQIDVDARQRFYDECRAGMEDDDLALLDRYFARHRLASVLSASAEGRVKLPPEIAEHVLSLGRVEWGQTPAHDDLGHGAHVADSVRLTAQHFGQTGDQHMHGLWLAGTETVLCHTGTSPNAPKTTQALVGAWNWLVDQAAAFPEPVPATNQAAEVERHSIRRSIIRQLGDDPYANRIILNGTDWDIVLEALRTRTAALATQPATSQEGEEAPRVAAFHAIYGPNGDLFENPEGYAFASDVADAVLAATPTPPTLSEGLRESAVAWCSPGQLANLMDVDCDGGVYLPIRKTRRGNFTMPLFADIAAPSDVSGDALRMAVAKLLPIGNDSLPGDRVIPIYVRMDELRALHTLAQVKAS